MGHGGDPFSNVEDEEAMFDSFYSDCGCPGPPPPPILLESFPPPPPAPSPEFCTNDYADYKVCEVGYLESKLEDPGIPSFAIIIVCAILLIVMVTVIVFLVWRHKRKAHNLGPCKGHQSKNPHCDISSPHNVPTYEDALINHHAIRIPNHIHRPDTQTLAPIELLDVNYTTQYNRPPLPDRNVRGMYGIGAYPGCSNQNTSCSSTDSIRSKDSREQFNPVYEEVSGGSHEIQHGTSVDSDIDDTDIEPDSVASEDEFAEDELSLADFPKDSDDISDANGRAFRPISHNTLPCDNFNVGKKRGKSTSRSIDRNIDRYPSDTLRAKHNYYVSKDKMAPDLRGGVGGDMYNSNRKHHHHHYPSKNSNHAGSHPRSSRGNYNRNSSGSGGSAVNSHSTGTPPYNDHRTQQMAPGHPHPYLTSGRNHKANNYNEPMDHHWHSSMPHSRITPSDMMYNRMSEDGVMPDFNNKMKNSAGHRPDNFSSRHQPANYGYNRKQQTPTDHHRDLKNFQPQKKFASSNSQFSPLYNEGGGGPFTIDGPVNPHVVNPLSVASHTPSDKTHGTPVSPSSNTINYPSGQSANKNGPINDEVRHQEEPIYNELDPVYAQRPLYT